MCPCSEFNPMIYEVKIAHSKFHDVSLNLFAYFSYRVYILPASEYVYNISTLFYIFVYCLAMIYIIFRFSFIRILELHCDNYTVLLTVQAH